MKKRMIPLMLVMSMVLSMFPALTPTAQAADDTTSWTQFLKLEDSTPEGFDANSAENPYSNNKNSFMLSTQHELLLYTNRASGGNVSVFDTYKGTGSVGVAGSYYTTNNTLGDKTKAYDYVRGAAGNLIGGTDSSREQYVAYVGYNKDSSACLWVQDAVTGNILAETTTVAYSPLLKKVPYYQFNSVIGITTGDFDGDGIDTIVVYASDDVMPIWEFRLVPNGNGYSLSTVSSISLRELHPDDTDKNKADKDAQDAYSVSITAGDLDGDGKDELAVATGVNRASKTVSGNILHHGTYVSIFDKSGSRMVRTSQLCLMNKVVLNTDSSGATTYGFNTIYAPGISVGDLNNDGVDDLAVAGYLSNPVMKTAGTEANMSANTSDYDNVDKLEGSKLGAAIISYTATGYGAADIQVLDMNTFTLGGTYATADDAWPQVAVQCVAVNGIKGEASVFVAGALYTTGKATKWDAVYTPDYFNNNDDGAGSVALSNTYVESVIAGNFDGNNVGREQVIYTVALKESGAADYFHFLGQISGVYADSGGNYGNVTGYTCSHTGSDPDRYIYDDSSGVDADLGEHLSVVPVAVDVDSDGVEARLAATKYMYSDPQIKAVLQAAPYTAAIPRIAHCLVFVALCVAGGECLAVGRRAGDRRRAGDGFGADRYHCAA